MDGACQTATGAIGMFEEALQIATDVIVLCRDTFSYSWKPTELSKITMLTLNPQQYKNLKTLEIGLEIDENNYLDNSTSENLDFFTLLFHTLKMNYTWRTFSSY